MLVIAKQAGHMIRRIVPALAGLGCLTGVRVREGPDASTQNSYRIRGITL